MISLGNFKTSLGGNVSRAIWKEIWERSDMAVGNLNKITLTEGDIAGALLKGNTISQLTIPELKRWLSYRKEAKLIERSEA